MDMRTIDHLASVVVPDHRLLHANGVLVTLQMRTHAETSPMHSVEMSNAMIVVVAGMDTASEALPAANVAPVHETMEKIRDGLVTIARFPREAFEVGITNRTMLKF